MTNQIKPSVTNPTIANVYKSISDGELDISPDFQRKFVWTVAHQEKFLETISLGYPFPEIYVCSGEIDLERMRVKQVVIDGQQRLTTIKNYIEDSFEKPLREVKRFSQLKEEEKEKFLSYQIVVRDIGKIKDEVIKDIFKRINSTKFKLEDVEIHNAIYDGFFIQIARDLSQEIGLSKYGVFYKSEFTRMADIYFFLQVMSTLERRGYFHGDSELEKCIAEFNEEYPNALETKNKILEVFSLIDRLEIGLDSIWFRKSNFFTLIVELCLSSKVLDSEILKENLINFERRLVDSKNTDSEFGRYYGYMYAGTTGRKARVTRSEVFRKYVLA